MAQSPPCRRQSLLHSCLSGSLNVGATGGETAWKVNTAMVRYTSPALLGTPGKNNANSQALSNINSEVEWEETMEGNHFFEEKDEPDASIASLGAETVVALAGRKVAAFELSTGILVKGQ